MMMFSVNLQVHVLLLRYISQNFQCVLWLKGTRKWLSLKLIQNGCDRKMICSLLQKPKPDKNQTRFLSLRVVHPRSFSIRVLSSLMMIEEGRRVTNSRYPIQALKLGELFAT